MVEEIAVENNRISNFDLGSGHTAYRRASLIDLYPHAKCHWNWKNVLCMDGRPDGFTDGHLTPALLGRLCRRVDLKSTDVGNFWQRQLHLISSSALASNKFNADENHLQFPWQRQQTCGLTLNRRLLTKRSTSGENDSGPLFQLFSSPVFYKWRMIDSISVSIVTCLLVVCCTLVMCKYQ